MSPNERSGIFCKRTPTLLGTYIHIMALHKSIVLVIYSSTRFYKTNDGSEIQSGIVKGVTSEGFRFIAPLHMLEIGLENVGLEV